jgi:FG-GAP-like repeat
MINPILATLLLAFPTLADEPLKFERIVIDENFPGGYQVEVADVNGDKKPDIVALGGSTLAWYENPSWKKRIITKGELPSDIISSATADLDGDGKAEIAVACDFAMNTPTRGKLLLAIQGATLDDKWTFKPIADVPSIHRLRWGDLDGDGKIELVVAPLFGPKAKPPTYDQDTAQLVAFGTGAEPKAGRWQMIPLAKLPVIHAIEVKATKYVGSSIQGTSPQIRDGSVVFTADNTGVNSVMYDPSNVVPVTERHCIPGVHGAAPNRGSSEVHFGKLVGGRTFLATIDHWHGSEVSVCLASRGPTGRLSYRPRTVLDNTLDDGHALWVADVDGDGNDEIFAGHRGKDARVSVYRFDGKVWNRTVLDPALTAQDLRGGDIDGNDIPDVVAIGGKSHNIVWFRPLRVKGR